MVSYFPSKEMRDWAKFVLILIVVDNGLVLTHAKKIAKSRFSLNPCCSGQWPRTRPYKTILIISKLKNFTKQILTFLNRKLTIPYRVQRYDFFLRYASQLFLNI